MKLTKIEMGPNYIGYNPNAVPGIKCLVELQVGERYSSSVTVTLTPEQTRDVVALAVQMAMTHLAFDPQTIDVVGSPGTPREPVAEALPQIADDDMVPL